MNSNTKGEHEPVLGRQAAALEGPRPSSMIALDREF